MDFSYPPAVRLRSGWEFDLLFRTGRRVQGRLVRLLFLKADGGGVSRFGLVVGKRQGGATVRNRGRRVLREAVRHLRPWVKEGQWIVVSLRNEALQADSAAVYADMGTLLERVGLLRSGSVRQSWDDVVASKQCVDG